jgi:hypothetical protein
MRKLSKNILALLFACLILFTLPIGAFAADEQYKMPAVTDHLPYYYYNQLTKEEQDYYLNLRQAVMNRKTKINLKADEFSEEFINKAHMMLFYYDSIIFDYKTMTTQTWVIETNSGTIVDHYEIEIKYEDFVMSKNNYVKAVNLVDRKVDKFIKSLDEDLNSREKVVMAFNFIRNGAVYDSGYKYCHSPYSALIAGKTVCDGYARALQYICEELDIPCVISIAIDDPDNAHAWNKVKFGKNWYVIDATEAEDETVLTGKTRYDFLFLADSEYAFSKETDVEEFVEPKATDTTRSYYELVGKVFSDYNSAIKYIAAKVKSKLPVYVEFFVTDKAAFNKFVNGDYWNTLIASGIFKNMESVASVYWVWDDNSGRILIHFYYA